MLNSGLRKYPRKKAQPQVSASFESTVTDDFLSEERQIHTHFQDRAASRMRSLFVFDWISGRVRKRNSGLIYSEDEEIFTLVRSLESKMWSRTKVLIFECKESPSFNTILKALVLKIDPELKAETIAECKLDTLLAIVNHSVAMRGLKAIAYIRYDNIKPTQWARLVKLMKSLSVNFIGVETKEVVDRQHFLRSPILSSFVIEAQLPSDGTKKFQVAERRSSKKSVSTNPLAACPKSATKDASSACTPATVLPPSFKVATPQIYKVRNSDVFILVRYLTRREAESIARDRDRTDNASLLIDDCSARTMPVASFLPTAVRRQSLIELSCTAKEIAMELEWTVVESESARVRSDLIRIRAALKDAIEQDLIVKFVYQGINRYITRHQYRLFNRIKAMENRVDTSCRSENERVG